MIHPNPVIIVLATLSSLTSSNAILAAGSSEKPLAENWYVTQPWAQQPPVNIYKRVAAVQSAIGGVKNSIDSYTATIKNQAAQQNRQVLLQAELARAEAAQIKSEPRRGNFATRGTAEQIDEAANARLTANSKNLHYAAGYSEYRLTERQAYELGVTMAEMSRATQGWGNDKFHRMMRQMPK